MFGALGVQELERFQLEGTDQPVNEDRSIAAQDLDHMKARCK